MKTTIVIADDLFKRAQAVAHRRKTTFRALTEEGLRLVLTQRESATRKLPPLATVRGRGLNGAFRNATWDQMQEEIYRGRGA